MMSDLYLIMFMACMNSMIPSPEMLQLLPEHHRMYIVQGSAAACRKELSSERMMMCIQEPDKCEPN